jgi:hypothetical protein
VRRLLAAAGPRPAPPAEDLAAITAAARAEWRRLYGGRAAPAAPAPARARSGDRLEPAAGDTALARSSSARPRRWLPLAAAAALAVALGAAWWLRRPAPPAAPPTVATIEVVAGEVRLWTADGKGPLAVSTGALGRPLPTGSEVETAGGGGGEPGRLALRTAGGASLRLDAGTRLRLASAGRVELDRGAVYIDSGADPGGRGRIAVATAAGVFHELGTQFEVRTAGGAGAATLLRVREGRVALERGGEAVVTAAGEELTVHGDGRLDRARVAAAGPGWEWVLATAPRLDIEGVTVREFLDWVARETGLRIEFADREAAALADSVVLHGSIAHLSVDQALGTALASAGLGYRIADAVLEVFADDR